MTNCSVVSIIRSNHSNLSLSYHSSVNYVFIFLFLIRSVLSEFLKYHFEVKMCNIAVWRPIKKYCSRKTKDRLQNDSSDCWYWLVYSQSCRKVEHLYCNVDSLKYYHFFFNCYGFLFSNHFHDDKQEFKDKFNVIFNSTILCEEFKRLIFLLAIK